MTLAIWWTLLRLEEWLAPLRIVASAVFLSVVLEMVIVPLLLLWHWRLARAHDARLALSPSPAWLARLMGCPPPALRLR